MQLTYLGHAGFCLETDAAVVVMDPWLTPTGAFDSAWFQFPRNHHLAALVSEKLRLPGRSRFVYVSHEHKDHFDLPFLERLESRDFDILIPRFERTALRDALSNYTCQAVRLCNDAELVAVPGGFSRIYVDEDGINRDSAILTKINGLTFLNLNDCKIFERLPEIVEHDGPIDVFTCQFSGATWHPTCYDYAPAEYERISRKKMLAKFETVARAIQIVQPRLYIPSAGPPCFLDPDLIHLNAQRVNIFPRAETFLGYLNRRLKGCATRWLEMGPGDSLDVATGETVSVGERICEEGIGDYIRDYAVQYQRHFEQLKTLDGASSARDVLESLRLELGYKLSLFRLRSRMHAPLYFGLTDLPDRQLMVDFHAGAVHQVPVEGTEEHSYYRISAPSWQVHRVLKGLLSWEDFSLSFRARLAREPDLYQTILQGFLILEAEDLDLFCSRLLDIEARGERTVVEAGGRRYSIARYCPHLGGDLEQGAPGPGAFWTCPRHAWQFDLAKGGLCTTNSTSIDAVGLEDD